MVKKTVILFLVPIFFAGCAPKTELGNSDTDLKELECRGAPIVGGRSVLTSEALSKKAVLLLIRRGENVSACTAVPVAPKVLLTAAHCVSSAPQDKITAIFHPDMKCSSGYTPNKSIGSASYVTHQDYDGTPEAKADLALVTLSSPIPSDYPIAIFYESQSVLSSDEVLLLGFGITGEAEHDSLELRTTLKSFRKDTTIKEQVFGIRQDDATGGFCRGDSGSPIYVRADGVQKLIGINSFNIGTAKNNECHTASAAMYIPYFLDWIHTQLNAMALK